MIRPLRLQEFSQVEAWRRLHFAQMRAKQATPRAVCGQYSFTDAVWMALERRGTLLAALSFTQDNDQKIRWCHDMYAAEGYALAGLALGEWFERMCDRDGFEMRGSTDPENVKYLQLLLGRGYELTAVQFRRRPRKVATVEKADTESLGSPVKESGAFVISETC